MASPSLSRSLHKVRRSLPNKVTQKKEVTKVIFEEAINATPRKVRLISQWSNIKQKCTGGRPLIMTPGIDKLDSFICHNDISFTLPGRNNQVYLGKNEQGGRIF